MMDDGVSASQTFLAKSESPGFGQMGYAILRTTAVALSGIGIGALIGLVIALFTGLFQIRC